MKMVILPAGNLNMYLPRQIFCFLIIIILLCIAFKANAQFKRIYIDNNADTYVQKISMYSASEGFVAFNNCIGFTTDSGKTFVKKFIHTGNVNFQNVPVNITFGFFTNGIKAFDKNKIIVYGNYALVPAILISTDGGNTFKLVYHSQHRVIPGSTVTDMAFANNGAIGYAVDYDQIIKTVDGGMTWTVSATYNNSYLTSMQVFSDAVIYIYNRSGDAIYSSVNGGLAWQKITQPGQFRSVYFLNPGLGWLNGVDDFVYKTTNNGVTWTKQNDALLYSFSAEQLIFENDSTGYGLKEVLYKTTNGGKIWEPFPSIKNNSGQGLGIFDMQILGNQIWVGGSNGYLALSTNKGGPTIPRVYFSIDESAVSGGGQVKLNNFGKTGYKYNWFKNGKLISKAYNASYLPDIYKPNDTIKLVVSNSLYADSATKITTFSKAPAITGFSQGPAGVKYPVDIYGSNFRNVTSVSFGGVRARSFKVLSENRIEAMLQKKTLSGEVKVTTANGLAIRKGFVFKSPPLLKSAEPMAAVAGTKIIIRGTNFSDIEEFSLSGSDLEYKITSDTTAEFILPATARSGKIVSEDDWNSSVGWDTLAGFKIMPVITSVSRKTGQYRSYIGITGSGIHYSDIKSITIDGYPVKSVGTYSNNYGTEANFVAGEGGDNGIIKVETIGGSYEFKDFTYYKTPQINELSSYSGAAGDLISITGKNFSGDAAEMHIYFGAVKADIISASTTRVEVKVPTGATYNPVTVRTNDMVCYSVKPFILTFKGGGNIDENSFGTPVSYYLLNGFGIRTADIDNDGKPEIVHPEIGVNGRSTLRFIQNNSKPGNLATGLHRSIDRSANMYGGAFSDYDNDGKLDYVGAFRDVYTQLEFADYYMRYSVRNDFYMISRSEGSQTGNGYATITDLDKDGTIDLVNGYVGDLDGDGYPDVVWYDYMNIIIRHNIGIKGRPEYTDTISLNLDGKVHNIALGDLDGDNLPDIVVGGEDDGLARIYKNTSTINKISFVETLKYNVGHRMSSVNVQLGDLDGDGLVDIIFNTTWAEFNIYKNKSKLGELNFTNSFSKTIINGLSYCRIADMDGDGRPDIVGDGLILRNLINTPQISSFTPEGGAKDQIITITGGDFTGTTAVAFGGINAKSFKVNSANSITAVTDSAASGYIAVTTPQGTGNSLIPFKFLKTPIIYVSGAIFFNRGDSTQLYGNVGDSDNEAYNYQWKKNGVDINGANKYYITVKETGDYSVSVSYGNSAKLTSLPLTIRSLFKLPQNNFNVSVSNISCRGKKEGAITIKADTALNYIASIDKKDYPFSRSLNVSQLLAGTYDVCIVIKDNPDFKQCFTVQITEPPNLVAMSTPNLLKDSVKVILGGGEMYKLNMNGKLYTTVNDNITLPLVNGMNVLEITTDKECQGVIKEIINGSTAIAPYPNPFIDKLNINIGSVITKVITVSLANIQTGHELIKEVFYNRRDAVQITTTGIQAGVYILTVTMDDKRYVYKVIK